MMKEGIAQTLEYILPDNIKRAGTLHKTDIQDFPPKAFDPNWDVWEIASNNHVELEWLIYQTKDSSLWEAKVHAEKQGGQARLYFEHKNYPAGGGVQDDVPIIVFLDWDRHPWQATILGCMGPFPEQPKFRLKRL